MEEEHSSAEESPKSPFADVADLEKVHIEDGYTLVRTSIDFKVIYC